MPQIIRNMGFTSTNAQLLTAPPYLLGAINAVLVSAFADRFSLRSPFILGPQSLVIVAYSVLFVKAADIADNIPLCYAMVTIACMGIYPIIPVVNSWCINNLAGPEKRNIGSAYFISLGTCGGIIGSFIFIEGESPHYPTGFGTSLAFGAAGICSVGLVSLLYRRHNKKYAGWTKEDAVAKFGAEKHEKMGDSSPMFTYSL
jgi:MFS family permease